MMMIVVMKNTVRHSWDVMKGIPKTSTIDLVKKDDLVVGAYRLPNQVLVIAYFTGYASRKAVSIVNLLPNTLFIFLTFHNHRVNILSNSTERGTKAVSSVTGHPSFDHCPFASKLL